MSKYKLKKNNGEEFIVLELNSKETGEVEKIYLFRKEEEKYVLKEEINKILNFHTLLKLRNEIEEFDTRGIFSLYSAAVEYYFGENCCKSLVYFPNTDNLMEDLDEEEKVKQKIRHIPYMTVQRKEFRK